MAEGYEVYDKFYKLPDSFRMGDPVLVEEVTGLSWGEFSDRIEDNAGDPAVMLGMLAVAVWQTNNRWRRDKVARFVEALNIEDVKFVGEDADESPPDQGGLSAKDDSSTSKSDEHQDSPSDTNPDSTTPDG